jgi:hypothetical protein
MRGWRYRYILEDLGTRISLTFSTACVLISQTANVLVPARLGDLVRVFLLRHEYDTSYEDGLSSLVVERVFDVVMVAVLGLLSLPFVLSVLPPLPVSLPAIGTIQIPIIWLLGVPLLLGGFFFLFIAVTGSLTARHRVLAFLLRMMEGIRKASLSVRAVAVLGISSLAIWMTDVFACVAVALSFGQAIPLPVIVLAIVAGNLVKAIPLTPGGLGIYEFTLSLILPLGGISGDLAKTIALVDHLIKNGVTVVGGLLSIRFLGSWVVAVMKRAFRSGGGGDGGPA